MTGHLELSATQTVPSRTPQTWGSRIHKDGQAGSRAISPNTGGGKTADLTGEERTGLLSVSFLEAGLTLRANRTPTFRDRQESRHTEPGHARKGHCSPTEAGLPQECKAGSASCVVVPSAVVTHSPWAPRTRAWLQRLPRDTPRATALTSPPKFCALKRTAR